MGIFDSKPSPKVRTTTVQKPKKVVISVGNNRGGQTSSPFKDAREIIQDARDEAFRIKKAAEEEIRKIRQESLDIERRIAQKAEEIESNIRNSQKQAAQLSSLKSSIEKKEQ